MDINQIWKLFKAQGMEEKFRRAFMIALSEYGVKETPGSNHSPEVMKYFHESGFSTVKDDETSWCSAFMNWCMMKAGIEGTGSLAARSWIKWGIPIDNPQPGDIVVFWRVSPESWEGHVGFFIRKANSIVYTLGGNQSNTINIQGYPESQILGYRRWGQ